MCQPHSLCYLLQIPRFLLATSPHFTKKLPQHNCMQTAMTKTFLLLPISLALLLLLFSSCLAEQQLRKRGTQFSQQNECQINNLDALEPDNRIEAEAGVTEVWDHTHKQFQCAGVAFIRRRLEPNGLLLPSFTNVPQLVYIVRGRGYFGAVLPGCPETFQESQEERGQFRRGEQGESEDQHQKIRHFRQGDTIALPAGISYWYYNSGEEPLVVVALLDTTNANNQLDRTPRKFFLGGNPEQEFEEQGQQQGQRGQRHSRRSQPWREERSQCNNLFCGFDEELLAEAFNVDPELIKRLQNEQDNRGNIVRVEGRLEVTMPPMRREQRKQEGGQHRHREREWERERGRGGRGRENGLEETFCSMRLRENIGDPSRADVFVPRAGRISTINSHNLPILRYLQLSAEHGVLYRNGIMVPHWNMNAHSIVYGTRGRARIQVVDHNGNSVFDDELEEGQVLTIPQNFAVLKRAGDEGFEWVSFKTNDNAMINPLVGRTSAIRGIPGDVLRNAFRDLSDEDVQKLKNNRRETTVLSPSGRSERSIEA